MEQLSGLLGTFGAIIAVGVLALWAVLMFLVPFFVWSCSSRAKQANDQLQQIIERLTPP